MSHRPLVLVSALTLGDYELWNWSLKGNHDVLALVAGLTLPPLAVACGWLLIVSLVRAIAHRTRRPRSRRASSSASHRRPEPTPAAVASQRAADADGEDRRPSRRVAA